MLSSSDSGDSDHFAVDTQTGLLCATGWAVAGDKNLVMIGDTPSIDKRIFIPACTDLYLNETRTMRDFTGFLHDHTK